MERLPPENLQLAHTSLTPLVCFSSVRFFFSNHSERFLRTHKRVYPVVTNPRVLSRFLFSPSSPRIATETPVTKLQGQKNRDTGATVLLSEVNKEARMPSVLGKGERTRRRRLLSAARSGQRLGAPVSAPSCFATKARTVHPHDATLCLVPPPATGKKKRKRKEEEKASVERGKKAECRLPGPRLSEAQRRRSLHAGHARSRQTRVSTTDMRAG